MSSVITNCLPPFTLFDEAGNIAEKLCLRNLDILLISHRSSVPSLLQCIFSPECIAGLSCTRCIKIQWRSFNRVSHLVVFFLPLPLRELTWKIYVLIESSAKHKAWADTWDIKSTLGKTRQLFCNLEKRKWFGESVIREENASLD